MVFFIIIFQLYIKIISSKEDGDEVVLCSGRRLKEYVIFMTRVLFSTHDNQSLAFQSNDDGAKM